MTMASFSNFIQDGASQAAAYFGGLGSTVLSATGPALISRVQAATAEVIAVGGGLGAICTAGLYSITAGIMSDAQASSRIGIAAALLTVTALCYLSDGISEDFWISSAGVIGALDPIGLGPRLVALQPVVLGAFALIPPVAPVPIPPVPLAVPAPLPQVHTPT